MCRVSTSGGDARERDTRMRECDTTRDNAKRQRENVKRRAIIVSRYRVDNIALEIWNVRINIAIMSRLASRSRVSYRILAFSYRVIALSLRVLALSLRVVLPRALARDARQSQTTRDNAKRRARIRYEIILDYRPSCPNLDRDARQREAISRERDTTDENAKRRAIMPNEISRRLSHCRIALSRCRVIARRKTIQFIISPGVN